MYRDYENPFALEYQVEELRNEIAEIEARLDNLEGCEDNPVYAREIEICRDRLIDLGQDLAEAEDRLRFAWDDDEADCYGDY